MSQPSILFLNCGAICYDSTLYFEQQIGDALEKLGWETAHVSVDKKDLTAGLKPYYGRHYDVIFDINTILPAATDENNLLCLNQIEGEVWHYVIDHPFYHHDALKSPLDHYNVICLDEKHAAFIRKHYPHIKRVLVLPLSAGSAKEQISYHDRKDSIIFTGTYTDPDAISYKAMKQPADLVALFQKMVDMLLENPQMTQEEAVSRILPGHDDKMPEILQMNYLADLFLQACIREELLKQILLQGLPLSVYGHGWEDFAKKCDGQIADASKNLKLCGEFHYDWMPEIYGNAKIAVNQTPWFKDGMHDRVPLALLNGCVCMTEKCPYLESRLKDTKELYYFSLEDMEGAARLLGELLTNEAQAADTAARGFAYAARHFTWEQWAKNFIAFLQTRDIMSV